MIRMEILDRLIRAGLGDIPQDRISKRQFDDTMREKFEPKPKRPGYRPQRRNLWRERRAAYLAGAEIPDRRTRA